MENNYVKDKEWTTGNYGNQIEFIMEQILLLRSVYIRAVSMQKLFPVIVELTTTFVVNFYCR